MVFESKFPESISAQENYSSYPVSIPTPSRTFTFAFIVLRATLDIVTALSVGNLGSKYRKTTAADRIVGR